MCRCIGQIGGSGCFSQAFADASLLLPAAPSRVLLLCEFHFFAPPNRDPSTGECLTTLRGHTDAVCSLSAAEGNQLVSSSWDKTARVWQLDASTEEPSTFVVWMSVWSSRRLDCGTGVLKQYVPLS